MWHGITKEMAKEFCRDYLGTLRAKNLSNVQFRSVREIAKIMGIDEGRCTDFVIVASVNKYLSKDNYELPDYMSMEKLYRVWEKNLLTK